MVSTPDALIGIAGSAPDANEIRSSALILDGLQYPTNYMPTDASLLKAYTEAGAVRIPMPLGALRVPAIESVIDGQIRFAEIATNEPRWVRVPDDLLWQFTARKTSSDLVRFARKYGPLGVYYSRKRRTLEPDPRRLMASSGAQAERIEWWHRYRAVFTALLAMTTVSEQPTHATLEDFRVVRAWAFRKRGRIQGRQYRFAENFPLPRFFHTRGKESENKAALFALQVWTEILAEQCGLRIGVDRRESPGEGMAGFHIQIVDGLGQGTISLFGALVAQLMGAAVGGGFSICKGCMTAFTPTREHRTYCSACGRDGVAKRRARSTSYHRKRTERTASQA